MSRDNIYLALLPPSKHANIPNRAQWLSGEGSGSWYYIKNKFNQIEVDRYAPNGSSECLGMFEYQGQQKLPPLELLQITYPSNCAEVSLITDNQLYRFERV